MASRRRRPPADASAPLAALPRDERQRRGRAPSHLYSDVLAGRPSARSVNATFNAFTVVGSGPNGANPHHEAGDRTIQDGDMIVLDFGGLKDGYGSDTSRTIHVGEPTDEEREIHDIVRSAQQAGYEAVRLGVECQEIDRAARRVITDAGHGEHFIHRTGHGIGLTTHEPPYMVEGETHLLEAGYVVPRSNPASTCPNASASASKTSSPSPKRAGGASITPRARYKSLPDPDPPRAADRQVQGRCAEASPGRGRVAADRPESRAPSRCTSVRSPGPPASSGRRAPGLDWAVTAR